MAAHSGTLAWKVPWTEKPGRLQSMGHKEVDTTEQLHFHFRGYMSCGAQQVTQKRRHFIQYFSSNFHTSDFTPHISAPNFTSFCIFFPLKRGIYSVNKIPENKATVSCRTIVTYLAPTMKI